MLAHHTDGLTTALSLSHPDLFEVGPEAMILVRVPPDYPANPQVETLQIARARAATELRLPTLETDIAALLARCSDPGVPILFLDTTGAAELRIACRVPSTITVKTFDNTEDMVRAMETMKAAQARGIERLNTQVRPWQERLAVGDCFTLHEHGLVVYGEILAPSDEERVSYAEPAMCFFRAARLVSEMDPEGERDDVHVGAIKTQIPRAEFERAVAALQTETTS